MTKILLVIVIFVNFVSGCASSITTDQLRKPTSAGSSLPVAVTNLLKLYEGPFEFNPDGFNRKPAKVFLPLQYDSKEKWPLVVMLHGFSGTADDEDAYLGLSVRTSVRGFLLLTPEGTKVPKGAVSPDGKDFSGNPFWNATDFCCDLGKTGIDDVDYLAQLIRET